MTHPCRALALAAVTVLVAAPALAQTGAASVAVRYDDLKLDAPGAADVLQRRIERAAADVCGGRPDLRDLDRRPAFDACRDEAISRAVGQLRVAGVLNRGHGEGISPLARR